MCMVSKPQAKKKPRGVPAILPKWWLDELNKRIGDAAKETVAAEVSKGQPRDVAWDRSTVAKFLKGKWTTIELMLAFSKVYKLPPPIIVARSLGEALHLRDESTKYDVDGEDESGLEKALRIARLDASLEELEIEVADQTEGVNSLDEGTPPGRRNGSVGRGRKTAS